MIGFAHVTAGGIIGATIVGPAVIPVAFVSHFAMDMLPHYGFHLDARPLRHWVWKVDVLLVVLFIASLFLASIDNKVWIVAGAFAALSPDFAWAYRYAVKERFGRLPESKRGAFNEFHANIQKYESARLLPVDLAVGALLLGMFIEAVR